MAEVYAHRLHQIFNSQYKGIETIGENDVIVLYETDTPYKTPQESALESDFINVRVLVQVQYQSWRSPTWISYARKELMITTDSVAVPLVFSVKKNPTYDELYDAVEAQLGRFASIPELTDSEDTTDSDSMLSQKDPDDSEDVNEKLTDSLDGNTTQRASPVSPRLVKHSLL